MIIRPATNTTAPIHARTPTDAQPGSQRKALRAWPVECGLIAGGLPVVLGRGFLLLFVVGEEEESNGESMGSRVLSSHRTFLRRSITPHPILSNTIRGSIAAAAMASLAAPPQPPPPSQAGEEGGGDAQRRYDDFVRWLLENGAEFPRLELRVRGLSGCVWRLIVEGGERKRMLPEPETGALQPTHYPSLLSHPNDGSTDHHRRSTIQTCAACTPRKTWRPTRRVICASPPVLFPFPPMPGGCAPPSPIPHPVSSGGEGSLVDGGVHSSIPLHRMTTCVLQRTRTHASMIRPS